MFEVDLELVPKKTEESALSSKAPAWKGNCPGENLDSNQEEKQKLKVKKKKKKTSHIWFQSSNPTDDSKPERKKPISLETRNSLVSTENSMHQSAFIQILDSQIAVTLSKTPS